MSRSATSRRTFLGGAAATAAAAVLPTTLSAATARRFNDEWIDEVPGSNRCLFDFNAHKNGLPLLHIRLAVFCFYSPDALVVRHLILWRYRLRRLVPLIRLIPQNPR